MVYNAQINNNNLISDSNDSVLKVSGAESKTDLQTFLFRPQGTFMPNFTTFSTIREVGVTAHLLMR